MNSQSVIQALQRVGAVTVRPHGPYFTFASGIKSPIYTDNRLLIGDVAARQQVARAFSALLTQENIKPDVVVGTATAGIPHATLLAEQLGLPMAYVRSGAKSHGKAKRIEGSVASGATAIVIEDLISTGDSCLSAAAALREQGVRVVAVFAIFSYGFANVRERFEHEGLRCFALATFDQLIEQLASEQSWDASTVALLQRWNRDPKVWPGVTTAACNEPEIPCNEPETKDSTRETRLIVSADLAEGNAVIDLAKQVQDIAGMVKLNSAFVAHGPALAEAITSLGLGLFLDLKFHDIPNTAANHVRAAAKLKASLLTVHAGGGEAMLRACADAAREVGAKRPKVLAVTALTSMSDDALSSVGITRTRQEQVQRLAALAQVSGVDGVVCSPAEAAVVRKTCGADFCIVTPGVRPADCATDDHAAAATPSAAIAAGADYVVVGRPIYQAKNPRAAAQSIAKQLR